MLKNFKSKIFLFCSSTFRKLTANSYKLKAVLFAFRNLPPTTYHLQPSPRNLPPNRGFAMLFSVLISSLLVVIGLSIFNITLKELTISTSARESQIAFYAANSGMECALYWDLKENAFAKSTDDYARVASMTPQPTCNGFDINNSPYKSGQKIITSTSDIQVTDSSGSCFDITITKEEKSGVMETTIESQGKNICGTTGRRVERGLRAVVNRN